MGPVSLLSPGELSLEPGPGTGDKYSVKWYCGYIQDH